MPPQMVTFPLMVAPLAPLVSRGKGGGWRQVDVLAVLAWLGSGIQAVSGPFCTRSLVVAVMECIRYKKSVYEMVGWCLESGGGDDDADQARDWDPGCVGTVLQEQIGGG